MRRSALHVLFSLALAASVAGGIKVTPTSIVARMGEDGTNDDLTARLCVGDECCDTLLLNGVLSDDWSSGDEEEWDEDWLGECAEKEFESTGNEGIMTVRLSKEYGTDSLMVKSLKVNVEFGPLGLGKAEYDCRSIFMNSLEVTKDCVFKMEEKEDGGRRKRRRRKKKKNKNRRRKSGGRRRG